MSEAIPLNVWHERAVLAEEELVGLRAENAQLKADADALAERAVQIALDDLGAVFRERIKDGPPIRSSSELDAAILDRARRELAAEKGKERGE